MKKELILTAAILGLTTSIPASGNKSDSERCFGISKKGMNECGNKKHHCATKAKADGLTDEWIYVPKGLCAKLANGTLKEVPSKVAKKVLKK